MRTPDAMFLHGGNFLKCEAGCIYHEGELCCVDLLNFITLYSDDEKDEKDQETGRSQPSRTTSRKHNNVLQVFED